jgi:hypothetical protein
MLKEGDYQQKCKILFYKFTIRLIISPLCHPERNERSWGLEKGNIGIRKTQPQPTGVD